MTKFLKTNALRICVLACLMAFKTAVSLAQCPSGDYSGNITISSSCTISSGSNITIDGDLTLNAKLTLETGATLTINGNIYISENEEGSIVGGTVNANDIIGGNWTKLTITESNITANNITSGYQGRLKIVDSNVTASGNFVNAQEAEATIDNSDITLTSSSGYMENGYNSKMTIENGSNVLIAGNMKTENISTLTIKDAGTSVIVAGSMNNDYYAKLNVQDDALLEIKGDFNNGVNFEGSTVNSGILNVDGGILKVGGDFNNEYASDVDVRDGGVVDVVNDVHNGQNASIEVGEEGTFNYGGTLTSDSNSEFESGGADDSCDNGCCGSKCGTLPVELLDYKGIYQSNKVTLTWATATEINNDYFSIYRSLDGSNFELIKKISGSGNSKIKQEYQYTENLYHSGTVYYTLYQTDYDGTTENLGTIALTNKLTAIREPLSIYPNPAAKASIITLPASTSGSIFQIYTLQGELAQQGTVGNAQVTLSALETGLYLFVVTQDGAQQNLKLLIQ